ncbi:putative N-acetylglucosaminyl phosphatidylinositol de-N-acetylase [Microthyrium microscopicum]|uniref:N-acetylglucosaminylphosphatidylinositol deacetylase n=1 Tax=Microthyrium microscopicum TaxID=703497 RepID=A0A6A6UHG4_9PEZI|nr:putative N-acetylglucosaminyl phosphatidylinositol de-N-acetylase [Microthyrium microscopicum]
MLQLPSLRFRRQRVSPLKLFSLAVIACPSILYLLLAYIVPTSPVLVPVSLLASRKPLLVTAHPDDESLFFGPTVLGLQKVGNAKHLRILVFSSGNNYGIGETRKAEAKEACKRIGAAECVVLDRKDIQDNPKVWWDQDVIKKVVKEKIKEWQSDSVLTFDSGGVSGHINHRAVSAAIVSLATTSSSFPPTFMLRTVPTFVPPRKYIGILDLPLTCLRFTFRIMKAFVYNGQGREWTPLDVKNWAGYEKTGLFVSSWSTWRHNVGVFWAHESQNSWDRRLYMLVSRYMWFNDITKVELKEKPT